MVRLLVNTAGKDLTSHLTDRQTEPRQDLQLQRLGLVPDLPSRSLAAGPRSLRGLAQRGRETHLLLLLSQAVPHGGHDFGHIPKGGTGVLSLDGGLSVSEEESIGRHGLLWLVGVLLLLLLWVLGLFSWVS